MDIVNQKDEVIGKKLRSEIYAEKSSRFRVVNAFLKNSEGRLWIPRRTATKSIFPLCLDFSMGGHVESGETYEKTFKRELLEELNIDADKVEWKLLGKLIPDEDKVAAFMNIYEIKSDTSPQFNSDDFIEASWIFPEDLIKKIEEGEKAKTDLRKVLNKFYSK